MKNINSEKSVEYWPGTEQILKSAKDVAWILGVHYNTISRWIKSGHLECTRIGKSIHFTYAQIVKFMEKNRYQIKINP